jgi:hypothetical protein
MTHTLRRQHGITMLEAAGVMLLLMGFVLSGLAMVDSLGVQLATQEIVDRALYDAPDRPFIAQPSGEFLVNEQALQAYAARIVETMEQRARAQAAVAAGSHYLVEVQVFTLRADQLSGKALQIERTVAQQRRGTLQLLPNEEEQSEPRARLTRFAAIGGTNPLVVAGPDIAARIRFGNERFQPLAVAAAARVYVSLSGTFSGSTREMMNLSPHIGASKAIVLRGEVQ